MIYHLLDDIKEINSKINYTIKLNKEHILNKIEIKRKRRESIIDNYIMGFAIFTLFTTCILLTF